MKRLAIIITMACLAVSGCTSKQKAEDVDLKAIEAHLENKYGKDFEFREFSNKKNPDNAVRMSWNCPESHTRFLVDMNKETKEITDAFLLWEKADDVQAYAENAIEAKFAHCKVITTTPVRPLAVDYDLSTDITKIMDDSKCDIEYHIFLVQQGQSAEEDLSTIQKAFEANKMKGTIYVCFSDSDFWGDSEDYEELYEKFPGCKCNAVIGENYALESIEWENSDNS